MSDKLNVMKRGFVDIPGGQVHFRTQGNGDPVLLLHQTPRSSDEFLDIIPFLAKRNLRVVALDTVGFGDSFKSRSKSSIRAYARAVIAFADALGFRKLGVVGHHTGAVIAFEIAVSYPNRVGKLVLSNCPFIDSRKQIEMKNRSSLDRIHLKEDGSHLLELWNGRKNFYPKERPDLLTRFIIDALKAGSAGTEGHAAVRDYNMERKFSKIVCPTLLICGTEDPFAYPDLRRLAKYIPNSVVKEIKGGTVAMMDQMPSKVAKVLLTFL